MTEGKYDEMKRKNLCRVLSLILMIALVLGTLCIVAYGGTSQAQKGVAMVSGGYMHSVLLKKDGTVWAWGKNPHGQLGDGTNIERTRPVQVKGLKDIVWIDAGGDGNDGFPSHTAAVKKDGTVWCWGSNKYGELGNGTTKSRNVPVKVTGITGAVKVSAGGELTAAVKKDGTVWCWGNNEYGQLGNGSRHGSSKPVQVRNLKNIVDVSAGYSFVLALDKFGYVWLWGEDIGSNPRAPVYRSLPIKIAGLTNVKSIGAGMAATVLKKDGTVWTWGSNEYGQLGNGYFGWKQLSKSPHKISTLSNIVSISSGNCSTAAVRSDGTVWCWGDDSSGGLGDNSCYDSPKPVQVKNLTGVVQAACGRIHTLAIKDDGSVWAWGNNWFGQIGDGTISVLPMPLAVQGISDVKKVSSGLGHTLALKNDGTLWGWGDTQSSQLDFQQLWPKVFTYKPIQLHKMDHVKDIAAGEAYSLALKDDGTVWGWGQNSRGQLGNGSNQYSDIPVKAKGLSNVVQITANQANSLALKKDGTVWFWGESAMNYAGNGRKGDSFLPVKAQGVSGIIAIASDIKHSAALKKDGTVLYWELDFDTDRVVLKKVPGINNAVAITCGDQHLSILRKDGTVWSLGNNQACMLGDGTTRERATPVQAKNLKNVCAIDAHLYCTLALKKDGTVWYWGSFIYGKSGSGLDEHVSVPRQVKGLDHVKYINIGNTHSVAIKQDGTVWCWGNNYLGQCGQPNTNRLVPVKASWIKAF